MGPTISPTLDYVGGGKKPQVRLAIRLDWGSTVVLFWGLVGGSRFLILFPFGSFLQTPKLKFVWTLGFLFGVFVSFLNFSQVGSPSFPATSAAL